MNPRNNWLVLGGILLFGLIMAAQTLFVVPQSHQALVLQFGNPTAVYNSAGVDGAGLAVKIPFMQNVISYDKRNLSIDSPENEIVTNDQERLVVDAYARWRIFDPLKFYQSLREEDNAANRLDSLLDAALRDILGKATANDIISGKRAQLMRKIASNLDVEARSFGIQILDVRIKQADLPEANLDRVFTRMQTERQQVAAEVRAKGEEQARTVRAEAEKQRTVLIATARETAERVKGEGDAKRNEIYARAYGKDPEFFAFYRSMIAYETAFKPENTRIVLTPRGDFFSYFGNTRGGGR